ncbi:hypothetical protein [Dyadobacter sp. CY326]|uniref:hypothetical protein n=1 Tax=Dyadobacter sp. CY326 TaxID=2907300 RepID=UPI001F2E1074|nr:hypothetical protein [Dyadobacter sp. CY326]MCE7068361.1 hypothetical protein [Dyadobacter sp. CY326]
MNVIIIIIASALLQILLPWWIVAVVPFIVFLARPATASAAFWTGFASIAIVWLAYGFYLHFTSDGAMSDRIAGIFSLPDGLLLLVVAAIVGGLTGGLAALSGCLTRRIFVSEPAGSLSR